MLTNPLLLPAAMAGLFGIGWLAYRGLLAGQVPSREALALSGLVAIACAAAALPLLKRVDQALAEMPAQDYRYRVVDTVVHLEPTDTRLGLPRIRFIKAKEFWVQYPVGSEVTIPLLRGPIGLWQLDHERFDPPVVAFYERQEAESKR